LVSLRAEAELRSDVQRIVLRQFALDVRHVRRRRFLGLLGLNLNGH
jgi:hypothetical protein